MIVVHRLLKGATAESSRANGFARAYQGEGEAEPLAVQRVRSEREAAFTRLTRLLAVALPVVDAKEALA